MKIKLQKEDLFIKGKNTELLYDRQGKKTSIDEKSILITSNVDSTGNNVVITPGEYEINDVLIYAMDINNDLNVDAVAVDMDGVKVLFLPKQKNIDVESVLESIGIVNVLVKDFSEDDINKQVEQVKEIEPNILVPLCPNDKVLQSVLAEFGAEGSTAQSSLSCKMSDFGAEEVFTSIALLK